MKKGNLDDALRILGFDINESGDYVYSDDDRRSEDEEDTNSEVEETIIPEQENNKEEIISIGPGPALTPEDIPIKMPGDEELTIEDAIDFIKEMLTGDSKSMLDVNNNSKLSFALTMVADKVNNMTYKSNPDYVGKVRALEQKIENYKKEFDKAKDLERKLYLIASAEERFYKHILEFGYEDIVIKDMGKATTSWQSYIFEKTGIDLTETRDIGEILFALKEKLFKKG